ncbi:hypothetical protein E3P89_00489 [Wallemia ichthyophaga]|uniref:Exonuclease V n=1 Tax=Wallemia ichthyophaga TaxID=245174 RepID=A0A4V4M2W1_WALIC|nr:hypothetical protein E3P90_00648 [Wallemia ichthyophaga]TIB17834.1 hypothetical protein E3P93_00505 [Wallemia ichthyophaga]TIB25510.1 hypothetical protein E3P89_00489 [Wallemia ichthyophaga]TIB27064.1 hypothetical protein E3P88_00517 [Wallemia ichthyophaga]
MASDGEFEDGWLNSAEVLAVASAVETGTINSANPAITVEMDDKKRARSRSRSNSVEIIETTNPTKYLTPYDRFRKKSGFLSATDVSDIQWCAYKKLYKEIQGGGWIRASERVQSIVGDTGAQINVDTNKALAKEKIMDKGSAHHTKMEREMYDIADDSEMEMEIYFDKRSDYYALWLHNCIVQLTTLAHQGRCREFGVRGLIDGQILQGDIDELCLDRKTGMVRVVDDKTRVDGKMPRYQNSNNKAQLMVYRKMLTHFPSFDWQAWLESCGINMNEHVSTPIVRQHMLQNGETDLRLCAILDRFKAATQIILENIDNVVELRYHCADGGTYIGKVEIEFDEREFKRYINEAFKFWHRGDYKGVDIEDGYFKCSKCEFEESCEWLTLQHTRAVEKNKKNKKV